MATLLTLFWVFSSFDPTRFFPTLEESTEDAVRGALSCACLLCAVLTLRLGCDLRRMLQTSPVFWLLLGFATASCLWSSLPLVVLRSSAALLAAGLLGYFMYCRLSLSQLLKLIAAVMGALAVVSLLGVLLLPEVAIHDNRSLSGAWRGIGIRSSIAEGAVVHGHRNQFGMVVALSLMAQALLVGWGDRRSRLVALVLLLPTSLLLKPIGSATAVVLSVVAILVVALGWLSERRKSWRLPALLSIGFMPVAGWFGRDLLAVLLGRSPMWSGRTLNWEHMIDVIMRSPVLGYGYGVDWTEVPALQADLVEYGRPWQATVHNGYLECAFWLGLVGVVLLAALLLFLLWSACRRFLEGEAGLERVFPLTLLLVLLLAALPEDRMLNPAHYLTVLLAYLAFHLGDPTNTGAVSSPGLD